MSNLEDKEIKEMIKNSDIKEFEGRFQRLKYLISIHKDIYLPYPSLCEEYNEEAKLCWYNGAFVASILMVQLTFEELFRSYFRMIYGVNGELRFYKEKIKVDNASFYALIEEACLCGWINNNERDELHGLRKIRNPYVHTKDITSKTRKKIDFFNLFTKTHASELIEGSAEEDAKFAVTLLIKSYPDIALRVF